MTSCLTAQATTADFPDRFSPILVKELRQGLRSRVFVSTFVLSHVCVVSVIGLELLASGLRTLSDTRVRFMVVPQFFTEFLFSCVLLSGRVLNAAGEESRASAMDLLRLTNFDASAVVFGKWKTQLLLATILLTSFVPYHLLRYYTHGVDVILQMLLLAWAWSMSALLSALCLCLSAMRVWARCLWIGGLLFLLPLCFLPAGFLLDGGIGSGRSGFADALTPLIVWSVIWFGLTMFFLTLAVSGFDTHMRYKHLID